MKKALFFLSAFSVMALTQASWAMGNRPPYNPRNAAIDTIIGASMEVNSSTPNFHADLSAIGVVKPAVIRDAGGNAFFASLSDGKYEYRETVLNTSTIPAHQVYTAGILVEFESRFLLKKNADKNGATYYHPNIPVGVTQTTLSSGGNPIIRTYNTGGNFTCDMTVNRRRTTLSNCSLSFELAGFRTDGTRRYELTFSGSGWVLFRPPVRN